MYQQQKASAPGSRPALLDPALLCVEADESDALPDKIDICLSLELPPYKRATVPLVVLFINHR